MKQRYLLAVMAALLLPATARPADTGEWKLRRNLNGIRVYVRSVPGSGFKEFRAVAGLAASMASVLKLMEDTESYPQWFPKIRESRLLQLKSSREMVIYQMMDLPFPARDRDCIMKVLVSRDAPSGAVTFTLSALPGFLPEREGVIRVREISGSWSFVPDPSTGTITATYRMHSEPGGSLAGWMANAAVVQRPFTVLTNMRKMLKKPPYRDAKESELRLLK